MDLLKVPPKLTRGMGVSLSSLARSEDEEENLSGGLEHQHTLVSNIKNSLKYFMQIKILTLKIRKQKKIHRSVKFCVKFHDIKNKIIYSRLNKAKLENSKTNYFVIYFIIFMALNDASSFYKNEN